MVERAAAAEHAGLDSLFVGDHHCTPRPYYQNTAILGRMLGEWGDRPVGALYLLPLWHPVLVAEQVGTLASIAGGRFILQCALGRGPFAPFGIDPRHRPSRFEQALDIIRRLLAGEQVASSGRYQVEGARISPLPPEPVEVWIGASAEPAIDRAARLGDGWIAGPDLVPEVARRQIDFYRERCVAHGRKPGVTSIRRDFYIGADQEEAVRVGAPVVAAGYRGIDPGALVIGGPASVAESFRRLGAMGYDEILVRNLVPDHALALASIERLVAVRERL